jgi:hypothetical protein
MWVGFSAETPQIAVSPEQQKNQPRTGEQHRYIGSS